MASVRTIIGREKLAKAHAGIQPLPKIVSIALGSGGTDANGTPKSLTGNETKLFTERVRKNAVLKNLNGTTYEYSISIDADTDSLIGININEACLIDSEGDLVAVKTFTNKGLESGISIDFYYEVEY